MNTVSRRRFDPVIAVLSEWLKRTEVSAFLLSFVLLGQHDSV